MSQPFALVATIIISVGATIACRGAEPDVSCRVEKQVYGETRDGEQVDLYTLTNANGIEACVMTLGATLTTVRTPDRNGKVDVITLHKKSFEEYAKGHPLFGSVVGRYANRIADARFTIDGVTHNVVANAGDHHIHGGGRKDGFAWQAWKGRPLQEDDAAGVELSLVSPDGQAGFPGVIVYGTDGKTPNIVERNVIWNSGDHGIQAAAEAIVRNNVTFNNRYDGIHSHHHQSAEVGNLQILHNTVVCRPGGAGIRISAKRLVGPVVIANNAIYAAGNGHALRLPNTGVAGRAVTVAGNVGSGKAVGLPAGAKPGVWNPSGRRDRDLDEHFFPRAGSPLIDAANLKFAVADDFNRTDRGTRRDVGAFVYSARGNLGWSIAPGFKTPSSPNP